MNTSKTESVLVSVLWMYETAALACKNEDKTLALKMMRSIKQKTSDKTEHGQKLHRLLDILIDQVKGNEFSEAQTHLSVYAQAFKTRIKELAEAKKNGNNKPNE